MALTLVLCYNGWIGYEDAAAMVMGENIGTTVTANLAAMVANNQAKRAALAHFIINVFGVVWLFLVFRWVLNLVGELSVALHFIKYNPIYMNPEMLAELGQTQPELAAKIGAMNMSTSLPMVLALFNRKKGKRKPLP